MSQQVKLATFGTAQRSIQLMAKSAFLPVCVFESRALCSSWRFDFIWCMSVCMRIDSWGGILWGQRWRPRSRTASPELRFTQGHFSTTDARCHTNSNLDFTVPALWRGLCASAQRAGLVLCTPSGPPAEFSHWQQCVPHGYAATQGSCGQR